MCYLTHILGVIAFVLLTGALPVQAKEIRRVSPHPVWVLSNGFHSEFALQVSDAGPLLRSSVRDPQARWLIVGWGDRDFYMAKRVNLWIITKAVFWPTPSALHVVPLRKPPEQVYRHRDIVRLNLPSHGVVRLRGYLEAQFAKDKHGNVVSLGSGFSAGSEFFLGNEKFYFPKMCNLWVAQGFRRSGVPLRTWCAITAYGLMRQLKKHGVQTGVRRLPVDAF